MRKFPVRYHPQSDNSDPYLTRIQERYNLMVTGVVNIERWNLGNLGIWGQSFISH